MDRFFTFFQNHRSGILVFLLVLLVGVFLIQWLAWIFAKGRFKRWSTGSGTGTGSGDVSGRAAGFIFSEAAVKIINEFRHLLALLVVVIFFFALGYSLLKAGSLTTGDAVANMKGAIEGVVATLGGLVGSIIGYYFGESSVVKPAESRAADSAAPVQNPPAPTDKKAPAPPPKPEEAPAPPAKSGDIS